MKNRNKQVESINCEQAVARFNDYMDHYLKGKRKEELITHIAECKDCMERFEFEQLLKSKVHQLVQPDDSAMKEKIEKLIASL